MCAMSGIMQASAREGYMGVKVAPELHYRGVWAPDALQDYKARRNQIEVETFGYTAGITGGINVTDRLEIESGLQIQRAGYNSQGLNISTPWAERIPVYGMFKGAAIFTYQQHFTYLNIPVVVNCRFSDKIGTRFYGSAGIINSFKLAATNKLKMTNPHTYTGPTSTTDNTDARGYKLAAVFSVGAEMPFLQHFHLRIAPSFQFDVLYAEKTEGPVKTFLRDAGLNCSVIRKF